MSLHSWRITHVRRHPYGSRIIAVKCENLIECAVGNVINDIETNRYSYYVQQPNTKKADVHVVLEDGLKYIRTDWDCDPKNNLENLPEYYR